MRKLQSGCSPETCAERLRDALWEQFGWLRREPVRGVVLGRRFRLRVREYSRYSQDDSRVSCTLYGSLRRCGTGTEIRIWEFSGMFDPLGIVTELVFALFFFAQITDGSAMSILIFLLFHAAAYLLAMQNYQYRAEKYESLVVDLRYFVRTVLEAEEVRKG